MRCKLLKLQVDTCLACDRHVNGNRVQGMVFVRETLFKMDINRSRRTKVIYKNGKDFGNRAGNRQMASHSPP